MTQPGVPNPGSRPTPDVPGKIAVPVTQPGSPQGGLIGLWNAGNKGAGAVTGAVGDATDAASAVADAVDAARLWVTNRHNWTRVLWFTTGVVCFAIGAAMLAGRPAAQAAATVLPAGKALKAVTKG